MTTEGREQVCEPDCVVPDWPHNGPCVQQQYVEAFYRVCLPSLGESCGNCHRCTDPRELDPLPDTAREH